MNKKSYDTFFANMSNGLKMSIVLFLKDKESNVTNLSKELKIEQSKLSHALASLKCCKIVEVEHKGKERIYSLNKKTILPILKLIDKHAELNCDKTQCWCNEK